ncbi:MAG: trypsin-like peptidase domain-containing protein, partial [Candidatus Dormiibacterota bacterium]
ARGVSTESDPGADGEDHQAGAGNDRASPLPWVPYAPDSDLSPPSFRPPPGEPLPEEFAFDPEDSGRARHPLQRTISILVVVAMGVLIGSGAAFFGAALNHPAHQSSRDSPSASAPTPTPTDSAQLLNVVAANDLPEIVMVVAVGTTSEELGTGWPIDDSGDFLTNDHVVHNGESFHVQLASGQEYSAQVINDDPQLDLAEIHVVGLREQPFPVIAALPTVGEPVVVLASQGATGQPPVTDSRVNGLDESATVSNAPPGELSDYSGLIRISAKIYPGNSGGPMLNPEGQVVGILTLAAENGTGAFAIPLAQVDQEIQSWLDG